MDDGKNTSGIMHCWLMAKIEVGGEAFVALRGVNWRGEYDAVRPHASINTTWWHVPSSKFSFDSNGSVPSIEKTEGRVMPIIREEWPTLKHARIVFIDQAVTGAWGGFTQDGKPEAVTRIAFDLGIASELPDVVLRPNEKLPWPRHPVAWIKANAINELPPGTSVRQGAQTSRYIVSGAHSVMMETTEGLKEKTVTDLVLQQTVGDMFARAFGKLFSSAPHRHNPRTIPTDKNAQP